MKYKRIVVLGLLVLFFGILFTTKSFAISVYTVTNEVELKNMLEEVEDESYSEIIIRQGNYNFFERIIIPQNVTLKVEDGAVLNLNDYIVVNSNSKIEFGQSVVKYKGTESFYAIYVKRDSKNVEISGGNVYGGGINVCDASNINIKNITLNEIYENGIYAVNTIFSDLKQIKCYGGQKGIYLKNSISERIEGCMISDTIDGIFLKESTINLNIEDNVVTNFKNTGIQLYVGCSVNGKVIGNSVTNGNGTAIIITGTTSKVNGSHTGNIENNYIYNCKGDGIGVYHGSYSGAIKNNTLNTIGGIHNGKDGDYGIIIDSMMKANTFCTEISGNKLSNITYAGIAIYSGPAASTNNIYQDTAFVSGNIENNVLYNCGSYQHSKDWKSEKANGGKKGCLSGIYVDTHARVKGDICNNSINKTGEHGVYIHLCSFVKNIYGNYITNTSEVGIENYYGTVLGDIYNNKIENAGTDGIAFGENGNIKGLIRDNEIVNVKEVGIYVSKSTVTDIKNNIINNAKKIGIYINEGSKCNKINNNKMKVDNVSKGYGIKIGNKAKINTISGNDINCRTTSGIRIFNTYNNISITSNKIKTFNASGQSFTGIQLNGDSKYTLKVMKNSVIGNKTGYGIRLTNGKSKICENTIKKSSYPVYLETNKTNIVVKDNIFSNNKNNVLKVKKNKYKIGQVSVSSLKNEKSKKAKIIWKKCNEVKKYEIFVSTSKSGIYKKKKETNNLNCVVEKLIKGKVYYFKVYGYRNDGNVKIYTNVSKIKNVKIKK